MESSRHVRSRRTLALLFATLVVSVAWVVPAAAHTGLSAVVGAGISPTPTTAPSPSPSASVTPSVTPAPTSDETPKPSSTPSSSADPTESPAETPSPEATKSSGAGNKDRAPRPPAASDSSISTGSVLLALAVLLGAGLVLRTATRHRRGTSATSDRAPGAEARGPLPEVHVAGPASIAVTTKFVIELGEAMVDSNDPVPHVQATLARVGAVNGVPDMAVLVFPTALMVTAGGETAQTVVSAAGHRPLRLDQVDAIFRVAEGAANGRLEPSRGRDMLRAARSMRPPFTPAARVLGYAVMTVGLALVLGGGWRDLLVAGVLGLGVGVVRISMVNVSQPFQVFQPIGSAFGVAIVVFLLARTGADIGVVAPIVAPLVMFLPGGLLTTSVIELATGQMISGAGRLAAGALQLVLLALGILAAAQLVGIPGASLETASPHPLGNLAPWLGVAVFGVGLVVHQCARRSSFVWIVLLLYVAYAAQVVGGLLFGVQLSAFVGAAIMTPAAMLVSRLPSGPPLLVSFLPGFWLLVPGALGLVGVTTLLGEDLSGGVQALFTTGLTMIEIALGILVGLAVGRLIIGVLDRKLRESLDAPALLS